MKLGELMPPSGIFIFVVFQLTQSVLYALFVLSALSSLAITGTTSGYYPKSIFIESLLPAKRMLTQIGMY